MRALELSSVWFRRRRWDKRRTRRFRPVPAVQWSRRDILVCRTEKGCRVLGYRVRRIVLGMLCVAPALTLMAAGCAATAPARTTSPPGAREIDLDADGVPESVVLDRGPGGISIVDGDVGYRSRPKWWVVTADIGDTDHNGTPEVVALLDGPDGRHLALIGRHAGLYHERLVSSALRPVPRSLQVRRDAGLAGDVIDLDRGDRLGIVTYRWNGFGFTAVGSSR